MHSKQYGLRSSSFAEYSFFWSREQICGCTFRLIFHLVPTETTVDIMLSVSLVLEETSCASYPGLVGSVQLIVVWGLTILHIMALVCSFTSLKHQRPGSELGEDIGPVLGLQNIKCVALSCLEVATVLPPLKPAAVARWCKCSFY